MGRPPAHLLSWQELVAAPQRIASVPKHAVIRLDAAGANDDVERAFITRGAASLGLPVPRLPSPERGVILAPRLAHEGFVQTLRAMRDAAREDTTWTTPVASVEALFDKRVTSDRWRALGLPVPRRLHPTPTLDGLRAAMREAGAKQAYVKVAHSSSAALLALVREGDRGPSAMTTVLERDGRRFNTRILQRARGRALQRLLDFLFEQGAIVEVAEPKARLDGRLFDLRIVVVRGEPAAVVARTNTIPITNLHLGGRRGDLDALRALCPLDRWEAALRTAAEAARAFPSLTVGIDLLFTPRFAREVLIEGNAFGDFFPRLVYEGATVYERVVEAITGK